MEHKGEIYAPVVHRDTLRVLCCLIGMHGWLAEIGDFTAAFLNGKRDKPVYVEAPIREMCAGSIVWKIVGNAYRLQRHSG